MKILAFLRITDDDGVLSLTNIALYLVLVKLAVAPQVGVGEIATLLLALLNYTGKKLIATTSGPPEAPAMDTAGLATAQDLADLTKSVATISSAIGLKQAFGAK